MSVRIRLQRKGAKHMAFYRIVVADSRSPRDGRFVEQLGYYDPLRDPPEIKVDTPKVIDWLSKGAQPSGTVESLLRRVGIMQMWHEVKRGKSLDELAHIEDEARKKIDAKASMDRRRKVETKAEKSAKKEEDAKPEAPAEESKVAPVESEPAAQESGEAAEAEAADEVSAPSDEGGDAPMEEVEAEVPAGGSGASAEAEEQKPE